MEDLGLKEQVGAAENLPSDELGDDTAPSSSRSTEYEAFREAKNRTIRQFEQDYLIQVMAAVDGNVSKAARLAGMQRRDFQRLLRKHDVRRPSRWSVGPGA